MVNNILITTIFVVTSIMWILIIVLPFVDFQTEAAFAKKISNKNSYNYITINNNNELNALNNSGSNISLPTTLSSNHTTSSLPSAKTVLIVKGAALLRDKSYSPNPIIIHAQDSVNWKNMDDVVHTVTSGSSFSSPNRGQEFDSGFLGGSYTHKFMKPGVYNYFCQIHPTMVGKIIVE